MSNFAFKSGRILFLGALILLAANVSIQARPRIAELPGPLHYTVPDLIALLKSPYVLKRRYGARLLGLKGRPAGVAIPHLKLLEKDPDETVKRSAYESLLKLWPHADQTERAKLLLDLKHADEKIRNAAVRLILTAGIADDAHYKALLKIARKDELHLRILAIRTIGIVADDEDKLRPLLNYLREDRRRIRNAAGSGLISARDEAYRGLRPEIKRLAGAHDDVRRALVVGMSWNPGRKRRYSEFSRIILATLEDSDEKSQTAALRILKTMPDVAAANLRKIRSMYNSKRPQVRQDVLPFLPLQGDGPSLFAAVNDSSDYVAKAAYREMKSRPGEPRLFLADQLNNGSPDIADRAEKDLGDIIYDSPISLKLTRKLVDSAGSGNCRALRLLRLVITQNNARWYVPVLAPLLPRLSRFTTKATCGRDAPRLLLHLGKQGNAILRGHILRADRLSQSVFHALDSGDPAAMPLLFELVEHPSEKIHLSAAKAALRAAGMADPVHLRRQLERITGLLDHKHPRMRLTGVRVLSLMDHPHGARIPVMQRLLAESRGNPSFRSRVLIAAGEMGPSGSIFAPRIFQALAARETRKAAAEALERLGPAARPALEKLIACARDESETALRAKCVRLLPIVDPFRKRVTPVLKALAQGDAPADVRLAAARELYLPRDESIKRINASLLESQDPRIMKIAMRNLGSLGPMAFSTVPAMGRILARTTDRSIWNEAMPALARIHGKRSPSRDIAELASHFILNGIAFNYGETAAAFLLKNHTHPGALSILILFTFASDEYRPHRYVSILAGHNLRRRPELLDRLRRIHSRDTDNRRQLSLAVLLAQAGRGRQAREIFARFQEQSNRFWFSSSYSYLPHIYPRPRAADLLLDILQTRRPPGAGSHFREDAFHAFHTVGHGSTRSAKILRRWMNDPGSSRWIRFSAADVLTSPGSPYRDEAFRAIGQFLKQWRSIGRIEARMYIVYRLSIALPAPKSKVLLPVLRHIASTHHKKAVRSRARRTWIRIASMAD